MFVFLTLFVCLLASVDDTHHELQQMNHANNAQDGHHEYYEEDQHHDVHPQQAQHQDEHYYEEDEHHPEHPGINNHDGEYHHDDYYEEHHDDAPALVQQQDTYHNQAATDQNHIAPVAHVHVFEKTVTPAGFTFSYEISNADHDGFYYWTVADASEGTLLAITVAERSGSGHCSGSGHLVNGKELGGVVHNVNVECELKQNHVYNLWFSIAWGGNNYMSPTDPVVIQVHPSQYKDSLPTSTESAFDFSQPDAPKKASGLPPKFHLGPGDGYSEHPHIVPYSTLPVHNGLYLVNSQPPFVSPQQPELPQIQPHELGPNSLQQNSGELDPKSAQEAFIVTQQEELEKQAVKKRTQEREAARKKKFTMDAIHAQNHPLRDMMELTEDPLIMQAAAAAIEFDLSTQAMKYLILKYKLDLPEPRGTMYWMLVNEALKEPDTTQQQKKKKPYNLQKSEEEAPKKPVKFSSDVAPDTVQGAHPTPKYPGVPGDVAPETIPMFPEFHLMPAGVQSVPASQLNDHPPAQKAQLDQQQQQAQQDQSVFQGQDQLNDHPPAQAQGPPGQAQGQATDAKPKLKLTARQLVDLIVGKDVPETELGAASNRIMKGKFPIQDGKQHMIRIQPAGELTLNSKFRLYMAADNDGQGDGLEMLVDQKDIPLKIEDTVQASPVFQTNWDILLISMFALVLSARLVMSCWLQETADKNKSLLVDYEVYEDQLP